MAKILIIDDSAVIRIRLKNFFIKYGHTVVAEAEDGLQGFEAYQEHRPDLVTMDINMPKMNGIEAAKRITEIDAKAKIIVLSTEGHEGFIHDAIKSGAKYYLVKPFKTEHLFKIMNRILDFTEETNPVEDSKSEETVSGVVLNIDNTEQSLNAATDKLRELGYAVLSEQSLEKAYELAERGTPDLILIDAMQYGMHGFKILNMLKQNRETREIPVVVYSDNTEKESVLKIMQLGVVDYISKKSDLAEFKKKISANMQYSQLRKHKIPGINSDYIAISQKEGITVIKLKKTIEKDKIVSELQNIFNFKFIETISKTKIVFDVSAFSDIENKEKVLVHSIINLLQNKKIGIITGQHFEHCCKDESFNSNVVFAMSYGELSKSEAF